MSLNLMLANRWVGGGMGSSQGGRLGAVSIDLMPANRCADSGV